LTADPMELRWLRRENAELRRTNEILMLATRYAGDLSPAGGLDGGAHDELDAVPCPPC
jgi:hypothetical protein